MPTVLLIIADDLTGANDTGVQFAGKGISVAVCLDHARKIGDLKNDFEVLVINTDSRHLSPDEAYRRVYEVARQAMAMGIPHFYKKTDSTLRGNLGAELAALLDATGGKNIFFAPAYPKLHRTTKNGFHFVDKVALQQTSLASDPLNPIAENFIPSIIARQTAIPVVIIDPEQQVLEKFSGIVVMNAESNEDLQKIAAKSKERGTPELMAGSAGLAEFLPRIFNFDASTMAPPLLEFPLLIVNGSLHENSLRQIREAERQGFGVIKLTDEFSTDDEILEKILSELSIGNLVILTTDHDCRIGDPSFIAQRLAKIAGLVIEQSILKTLMVIGGDTLSAIASAQDWSMFFPVKEIIAGVPIVEVDELKDKFFLLTKAGGFGSNDLIMNLYSLIER